MNLRLKLTRFSYQKIRVKMTTSVRSSHEEMIVNNSEVIHAVNNFFSFKIYVCIDITQSETIFVALWKFDEPRIVVIGLSGKIDL